MDQTTRPLLIPPQFALYAEKHGIYELYQRLLSQLIIHKPEDPLQFLVETLKKDCNSPAVIVIGPPCSGKKTISRLLAKKTGAVLLTRASLLDKASTTSSLKNEIGATNLTGKKRLEPAHWAKIIKFRTDEYDCVRKGWILEDYPNTRAEALAMQMAGVLVKHSVILQAPDPMLIERAAGKRVDPKTGDIYHTTFDLPNDATVQSRLAVPEHNSEEELIERLMVYHRHFGGIHASLSASAKILNVDQPKGDVFNQVLDFISRPARSHAPVTMRILLIGPYGSGRRTQANALAKKYDIVNVSVGSLIKEAVANESTLGVAIRPHLAKKSHIPDSLLVPLVKERLGRLDCVSRGWVLHGFPRTREQADALERSGYTPNRVFFLDIPNDSILERITLRYLDPISGERFHMLFNPPPTQEIRDRLAQKSTDSEEAIKRRINDFYAHVPSLLEFYENNSVHINADQDPNTVFESIESTIVNPLPELHSNPAASGPKLSSRK